MIKNNLKLINKLWLGALNLFSYLTYFRESKCKFSIFFLYLNYSLVYPVFCGVIHFFCLSDFVFGLHDLLSIVYVLRFCSLLLFIHSKPYISFSWGLCDYLIGILLNKIHLILVSNLFWKYFFQVLFWRVYFILCSCMLKIVYSLSFILF